jgi:Tfp pilus assembly protein PilF
MSKYADHESIWLVKTAAEITGPYTFFEISARIENQDIGFLDEIRTPIRRWTFVRETPELVQVVKRVRDKSISEEKTGVIEEVTSLIDPTEITSPSIELESNSEVYSSNPSLSQKQKSAYKFGQEKNVSSKSNSYLKTSLFAMFVTIVLMFSFWFVQKIKHQPEKMSSKEALKLAISNSRSGNWSSAVVFFQKAQPFDDIPLKIDFIPILISEGYITEARQLITELSRSNKLTTEESLRLKNSLALSLMKEGDFVTAEQELSQIIMMDAQNRSALINHNSAISILGNWEQSWTQTLEIQKLGIADILLVAAKARALLNLDSVSDNDRLRSSSEELSRWIEKRREFRQELLLLRSALLLKLNDEINSLGALQSALSIMPEETGEFVKDPQLDYQILNWSQFSKPCEVVKNLLPNRAESQSMNALCLLQTKDLSGALGVIVEAKKKFSDDLNVNFIYAWLLFKSGKPEETKEILNTTNWSQHRGLSILKTNFCLQEKDYSCVEQIIKKWLELDGNDPYFVNKSAQLLNENKNRDKAKSIIENELENTPNYRPLLQLKQELSDEL